MTSKDHTSVVVAFIPKCDFPHNPNEGNVPAYADGRTQGGSWAYMCEAHFERYGVGLGLGKGQRLIVDDSHEVEQERSCGNRYCEWSGWVEVSERGVWKCPECGQRQQDPRADS